MKNSFKSLVKNRSFESKQIKNKEMKIADSVLLSLFKKGNEKCNISHAPWHRYSILNTNCINVIDPEGPEKI